MPVATSSWDATVAQITAQGQASGLSPDEIRAAIAVAREENGWYGLVNKVDPGGSYGVYQLNWYGQLPGFANWLQIPLAQAAVVAQQDNALVIEYALEQGGYLYNAIVQGATQGKAGPDLAVYAAQFGQVMDASGFAGVRAWWRTLFGGTGPIPAPSLPPIPAPARPGAPGGAGGTVPSITPPTPESGKCPTPQGFLDFGGAVAMLICYGERVFFIALGTVLVIAGLWLLVRSEGR